VSGGSTIGWLLASSLVAATASAQTLPDRFGAAGYFRIQARPDFQGGNGRLGYWNLYGRLMNEGPYAMLELKLDVLQMAPGTKEAWASLHGRIEGGSFENADPGGGNLNQFRISQLYVKAGNVLLDNVTWQLGSLRYEFGDLGLYDMRPAMLLDDTLGVSGHWKGDRVDVLLGLGDSGFAVRRDGYVPLLTAAIGMRVRLVDTLEIGLGAQAAYEPFIEGNRNSSYVTPGFAFEDLYRGEAAQRWVQANPTLEGLLPKSERAGTANVSWRAVASLSFSDWGPIKSNSFFIGYRRLHPQLMMRETYRGLDYQFFVADYTRDRYQLQLGDQMEVRLVPDRLDALLSVLYGDDTDFQNTIAASDANRTYLSALLRLQLYLSPTLHVLAEGVWAQEKSKNGNLYRMHYDSLFKGTAGVADSRGLEMGDSPTRTTVQGKIGLVLNPSGYGIFARPSLRLLYGLQYSTQQAAFGNAFTETLDQYSQFTGTEKHLHHLVSLEAEGWF
jgi:hypothetical protein